MKITLRQRASKKTDKINLYLEIYKGYNKDENGKIKHNRDYQYLEYFLYSNPKNPIQKQHNKENLKAAEAVKAQKILEVQNGTYNFNNLHKLNTNFIEYFRKLTKDRYSSLGNYGNWDSTLKHLINYSGETITFKDITPEFCEGFKDYLLTKVKIREEKLLSKNAASSYFNKFKAALNQAMDDKIINDNPVKRVKGIKTEETTREYLTKEELQALMNTECRYDVLKRAFLFSCFSGLRWSDINTLTWNKIQDFEDGTRIHFTQQKTKGVEYLDIPKEALKYLGERQQAADRVFIGLKYSDYMNTALARWILKAGITKQITFHCARHTYATLLLTNSIDIYTVSKMLGHRELKTTQIYTKVIDQKKRDAVNIFDGMFK